MTLGGVVHLKTIRQHDNNFADINFTLRIIRWHFSLSLYYLHKLVEFGSSCSSLGI